VLKVGNTPEAAHLGEAATLPLKSASKQKTRKT
jgi:hypothetical protein